MVWKELRLVRKIIADRMRFRDRLVAPVMQYIAASPGGMIRPALMLLAAKACGSRRASTVKVAAVAEMIHTATLLHDDVIDQADTRRGRPSVCNLWGNNSAVVAGDWLLAEAFRLSAEVDGDRMNALLADTAQAMCRGELTQNLLRDRWDITEQTYRTIIENKTARLFSTCCSLGVTAAGGRPSDIKRLAEFGLEIGMAFQHTDDLLDIIDAKATTRKTAGSDIANGKPTLAFIRMLEKLDGRSRNAAIRKLKTHKYPPAEFLSLLRRTAALEYVFAVASAHVDRAVGRLGPIADSGAGRSLVKIARSVTRRIDVRKLT
ncbi:MAG TPA: polyprenyl synthetase family protein [Sedimentisphaerales bacterium]|nr:polyprenyl synthetase family protein [Sedimentisphaerales bacterium]